MECIIRGKRVEIAAQSACLAGLAETLTADLAQGAPDIRVVINALDRLGRRMLHEDDFLLQALLDTGLSEAEAYETKRASVAVLNSRELHRKIKRELGGRPFEISRSQPRGDAFEGWMPMGVLGHVTSANDALLPFFSAVEGLLAGNINLIKTAAGAGAVALAMAEALCDIEPRLCPYFYVFPISSREKALLEGLFSLCDAIAVWGSDAAVAGVRELAPRGVRIVDWGHRISFAYVTRQGRSCEALKGLAADVCVNDQQACSAPQVVYYEAADEADLLAFAEALYKAMEEVSPQFPLREMSAPEAAELTAQEQLCHLAELMGDKKLRKGKGFRIFVENDDALAASPLYRTILLKAMERKRLVAVLRPFRSYLQSVGLSCGRGELDELTRLLCASGVTRITGPGQMLEGYTGEPHDGVYALPRYMKRISVRNRAFPAGMTDFSEIGKRREPPFAPGTPLLKKADFPARREIDGEGYLLLKSGGSSGKAAYAPHSYDDAETTYVEGARFLIAAGLDPAKDVCMNLFYAGGLYGGFISIYEALKKADVVQLPMAAEMDMRQVAAEIVANRVNVLVGMPTYLLRLFGECEAELAAYGGVEKLLYAGEHFDPAQVERLRRVFGVRRVASLAYGCNELGSLGYACPHCKGTEHHVTGSKYLEVLQLDCDAPAAPGETGRLVWTPVEQENIAVARYEIGDLGRLVAAPCPCGRTAPKFELLGRFGDIFKFATNYVHYGKIKRILGERLGYTGWLQLLLTYEEISVLTLCVEREIGDAAGVLAAQYPEIAECVRDKTGRIAVRVQARDAFVLSSGGGKVRSVVDMRCLE